MSPDDETLLEFTREEDFNDLSFFEKIAAKVFSSRDSDNVRTLLEKLQFAFLANSDRYRISVLRNLAELSSAFSLDNMFAMCFDTLVGNYLAILLLMKSYLVIDTESARTILEIVPRLEHINDVYLFGFPYDGEVSLEIDERVQSLGEEQLRKLQLSCSLLFRIGFFHESRTTVESFKQIYGASSRQEDRIRAQLLGALIERDFRHFSVLMTRLGYPLESEEQIVLRYAELFRKLEALSLPVYFDSRNLRYNGVLFNDNFFFLKFMDFEGKERILYPFSQVPLPEVNKVYDLRAELFYTPRERYGRLQLADIYSFKKIASVGRVEQKAIDAVVSMSEDEIDQRVRLILEDANRTSHSPIELVDVLTLNLFVNNLDDLRLSGFITKGESFGKIHLNTIGGQLLKACNSRIQVVFLIAIPPTDDPALHMFIQECARAQKNYCFVDRSDLARLFVSYNVL